MTEVERFKALRAQRETAYEQWTQLRSETVPQAAKRAFKELIRQTAWKFTDDVFLTLTPVDHQEELKAIFSESSYDFHLFEEDIGESSDVAEFPRPSISFHNREALSHFITRYEIEVVADSVEPIIEAFQESIHDSKETIEFLKRFT